MRMVVITIEKLADTTIIMLDLFTTADNPYQNHDTCGICNAINQKDKIAYLQKVMKDQKIYNVEITGKIDEETKAAIKKMQVKYGISQNWNYYSIFAGSIGKINLF